MKKQLLLFYLLIWVAQHGLSQWRLESLPFARGAISAVAYQNKVYFIGGSVQEPYPWGSGTDDVPVYNCVTSTWDSSLVLPSARFRVTSVAGDSAFYAFGGTNTIGNIRTGTNVVDIYKNGVWHTDTIADHIFFGSGVKAGSKLIFTGFVDSINYYTAEIYASDVVYIYDELTGIWSTSALSTPRSFLGAASDGTLAIFAGGLNGLGIASDVVDIYNTVTGSWTTAKLSKARGYLKGDYANGKFYFAGGVYSGADSYSSDVVDVYNGSTWSTLKLSVPRGDLASAVIGDNVYFIGGADVDLSLFYASATFNTVDVLNTKDGSWSRNDMDIGLASAGCASSGNKIIVGGGRSLLPGNNWGTITKHVQILDVNIVAVESDILNIASFNMYPNPSNGRFTVSIPDNDGEIYITDIMGNEISRSQVREKNSSMQLDDKGVYIVCVKTKHGVATEKLFVVK